MQINVNESMLDYVFNRLRMQEGKTSSKIISKLDSLTIFKVLANAKYKQDFGIQLTDLEKTIKDEAGFYIYTYVSQKYEEAKSNGGITSIVYPAFSNITLNDLYKMKSHNIA
ncbi:MAG: hypothetical protein IJS74_03830 [Clostridia bacterium]|nr:hypothetical protein [Clostridia bacterium]